MFARITKYKLKKSSISDADARLDDLKDRIVAMPGMKEMISCHDAEGHGYVISLSEDQSTSDSNKEAVAKLWGEFAQYLEGAPEPGGYNVVMHLHK